MAGEVRDTEMSELFESTKRGMGDAIAHSKSEKTEIRKRVSEKYRQNVLKLQKLSPDFHQ